MKKNFTSFLFGSFFVLSQVNGMHLTLYDLPTEIYLEILKFTNGKTFCALRKASKHFRDTLENVPPDLFYTWYVSSIKTERYKNCPLVFAAKKNHLYALKKMLKIKNINVNQTDKGEYTPLYLASKRGYTKIVSLLLTHPSINPNSTMNGWTPLNVAAYEGYTKIIRLLLTHTSTNPNITNKDGVSPLHWAINASYTKIIKLLLTHKSINPNIGDKDGCTPLHWSIYKRDAKVVKLLLKHKADPKIANDYGNTPLKKAIQMNFEEIIQLLK